MKILLVYPEIETSQKGFSAFLQKVFNKQTAIPRALLESSIHLPITWNERLIDLNKRKIKNDDFKWADYVIIKAGLKQLNSTKKIIEKCRLFGKKMVAEGELFNNDPNNFEHIDHLILHNATLTPFVIDLESNAPKRIYSKLQLKQTRQPGTYSLMGFSRFLCGNIHTFSA